MVVGLSAYILKFVEQNTLAFLTVIGITVDVQDTILCLLRRAILSYMPMN